MRVDLHHEQPIEIAFQRWMITQRCKQRWRIPCLSRPSETRPQRTMVEGGPSHQAEERPSLRGPRLSGLTQARGEILAKHDLVHFDLGAGLQAAIDPPPRLGRRRWSIRAGAEDDDVRYRVSGKPRKVGGHRPWPAGMVARQERSRGLPATKG